MLIWVRNLLGRLLSQNKNPAFSTIYADTDAKNVDYFFINFYP
jgi:hypothetical protein